MKSSNRIKWSLDDERTSVIVRKLICSPLTFVLLTWIWNHAIAIGTIIMNTFLIHEHWKHFQCFHRKICTVVVNGLRLLLLPPPPPPPPPLSLIVDTILKAFLFVHIKNVYTSATSICICMCVFTLHEHTSCANFRFKTLDLYAKTK